MAVINETMARRYWETPERAIGRKFAPGKRQPLIEVVGVAKNGTYTTFGEAARSYYFTPLAQNYQGRVTVLVRSKQSPDTLMPALRRELSALDPTVPVFGVRSMPQFLNRITSLYDMGASLIGTFAVMALAAGGGRNLWRAALHGGAEDARNRNPHGAWARRVRRYCAWCCSDRYSG